MKRSLVVLLVAALLAPLCASGQTIHQRIKAERVRAAQIQQRLHEKRLELNDATTRLNDLQAQLDQTNAAIVEVNAHLGSLEAQQRSTQARLNWNTLQLRAARASLALHDAALRRRLVDIYENGNLDYLNVLLAARSFSDFIERWQDLRLLVASNERTLRERKTAAARVGMVQQRLFGEQEQLEQEQQAEDRAHAQLAGLAQERSNLVAVQDERRHGAALQVAQVEELSAVEEARLEELIRQEEAALEAERRAQRRAAGIAGIIPPAESGAPTRLSWPVTGPITSPFGWRRNPFGGAPEFHAGLDIGVAMGTTVTAAADGTVIMAQWYGGYGNYILIDHGGGISTGYGHLSAIYVQKGQHVTRGQAIGLSGSTGDSTGPHVHFEVRKDGKPIDPSPFLH